MIKLKHIKMKNFMGVSFADIPLDASFIMLVGKSGQGKSTVLDQVCLSWLGSKFTRGDKVSDYVKQLTSQAEVLHTGELHGKEIIFETEIYAKGGMSRKIYYDGKTYATNEECLKFIAEQDIDYYFGIFQMLQGEGDVISMNAASIRNWMERLLNFNLQEKQNIVKEEIVDLQKNKESKQTELVTSQAIVDLSNKRLKELDSPPMTEEEFDQAKDQHKAYLEKIKEIDKLIEKYKKDLQEYRLRKSELQTFENQKNILEKKQLEFNMYDTLKNEILENIDKKTKDINETTEEIARLKSEIEQQKDVLADYDKRIEESVESGIPINNEFNQLGISLKEARKFRKSLEEKICPECGQPTEAHILSMIENRFGSKDIESIIKSFEIDRDKVENRLQQFFKENEDLKNQKKSCEYKTYKVSTQLDNAKNKSISFGSELDILERKLESHENTKPQDVSKDIQTCIKKIELKEKEVTEASRRLPAAEPKKEVWVQAANNIEKRLDRYTYIVENNKKVTLSETKVIEDNLQNIEVLKTDIEKINIQLGIRNEATKTLKDLRAYMIVKTCEELEALMNEVIHTVFPYYTVRIDQHRSGIKFLYTKTTIGKKDKGWLGGKMSSGFEKSLLSFAFRIALCRLFGLPFCMLDEADGSADDESAETLYRWVFSSEIFDQIFLITHKQKIQFLLREEVEDSLIYTVSAGEFTKEE